MYKTKDDLPADTRKKVIDIINARLVDSLDLYSQTKQAHWNVKGPHFIGLHELFDLIATAMTEYADTIAERAMQLGGYTYGTVRSSAKSSSLSEYPLDISGGIEHCQALSSALAQYGKLVRKAIDDTDELGDKDTADLFTEVSRGIDKWTWFVESHLQADN